MRVLVYIEGASDEAAMIELLRPLIQQKLSSGVEIKFLEARGGDRKKALLLQVPTLAARIIANDPQAIVVVLPDLYPRNKGFPHETFEELREGTIRRFNTALKTAGLGEDTRYASRFKVFCFKHDLEALILAARDALALRLGVDVLDVTWIVPVEDQNQDNPPKRIVEQLFQKFGTVYVETTDAPLILSLADYRAIANACPQSFKPFVDFLESL